MALDSVERGGGLGKEEEVENDKNNSIKTVWWYIRIYKKKWKLKKKRLVYT